MKRKISALLLLAMLAMICLPAQVKAADESDLTFRLSDDENSYYVSDCKESASGPLTIPATYQGKPVTGIGKEAFSGCFYLNAVNLPDSLKIIGYGAFYCCYITEITIPEGVTEIDDFAFMGCFKLAEATIPSSVKSIGTNAFKRCAQLKTVNYKGNDAQFQKISIESGNELLISAKYPGAPITEPTNAPATEPAIWPPEMTFSFQMNENGVGYYVCAYDTSVSGALTIPATYDGELVTCVGDRAFRRCTKLTQLNIPEGVISIGYGAFEGCTNLTTFDIPDGMTSIEGKTFYGCTRLTSVAIPDSVTSIGESAFYHCNAMTDLRIPDGVTSIGEFAFAGCTELTSVTIPDSVTEIGQHAFRGCTKLKTVYYTGKASQFDQIDVQRGNDLLLDAKIIGRTITTVPATGPATNPTQEPANENNKPDKDDGIISRTVIIAVAAVVVVAATVVTVVIIKKKKR